MAKKQANFERFEGCHSGGRYVRITASMIKHPSWIKLKPIAAKLYLYLKLKYKGQGDRRFICTYEEIEKALGFGDRSITAAFRDLVEKGFITVEENNRHRRKANVYAFSDAWMFHGGITSVKEAYHRGGAG